MRWRAHPRRPLSRVAVVAAWTLFLSALHVSCAIDYQQECRIIVQLNDKIDSSRVDEALQEYLVHVDLHSLVSVAPRPIQEAFPTDIGVVETDSTHCSTVMNELRKASQLPPSHLPVRRVFQDSLIQKQLLTAPAPADGHLGMLRTDIAAELNVKKAWQYGLTGKGIKLAIFDSGLPDHLSAFKFSLKERSDWTDEHNMDDTLGHGTFIASVAAGASWKEKLPEESTVSSKSWVDWVSKLIATLSSSPASDQASDASQCPGVAPEVQLYIVKVFTAQHLSRTSWFLDAFNYAIFQDIDIINLSIGGPDYADAAFTSKVQELSAAGIIMVSAIGNEGPQWGTLNNPADQPDVIGVGGLSMISTVAAYSSRGMTLWSLPNGYGRMKPDLLAPSQLVSGVNAQGRCTQMSGTSVASPAVAGAIALLMSALPEDRRSHFNSIVAKQLLMETATTLPDTSIFEQGAGSMNLLRALAATKRYEPHVSFFPPTLDLTDCPYMWPLCATPLYYSGQPVVVNVTAFLPATLNATLHHWAFVVEDGPSDAIGVKVTAPSMFWPYSGWLGVSIRVTKAAATLSAKIKGTLTLKFLDAAANSTGAGHRWVASLPITVGVVPPPSRERRVLWDQFHSLQFPPHHIPRDDLREQERVFDMHGDHMHTNFKSLFSQLLGRGYFVEVLSEPWTCFNASLYGVLIVADPEDTFHNLEISKLQDDILNHGLSLLVLADWHNIHVMERSEYFHDESQTWWKPITGGSNVPALNALLGDFGIQLGSTVFRGSIDAVLDPTEQLKMTSGVSIGYGTGAIDMPSRPSNKRKRPQGSRPLHGDGQGKQLKSSGSGQPSGQQRLLPEVTSSANEELQEANNGTQSFYTVWDSGAGYVQLGWAGVLQPPAASASGSAANGTEQVLGGNRQLGKSPMRGGKARSTAKKARFGSGNAISAWPRGGNLMFSELKDETFEFLTSRVDATRTAKPPMDDSYFDKLKDTLDTIRQYIRFTGDADSSSTGAAAPHQPLAVNDLSGKVPVVGIHQVPSRSGGRIAVFTDTTCLDDAYPDASCLWLFDRLMAFASSGYVARDVFPRSSELQVPYASKHDVSSKYQSSDESFVKASAVLQLDFAGADKEERTECRG